MLPGFLHRLMAEIRHLVEKPKYKEALATKTFRIHTPPAKPNCVAWLGGKNGSNWEAEVGEKKNSFQVGFVGNKTFCF